MQRYKSGQSTGSGQQHSPAQAGRMISQAAPGTWGSLHVPVHTHSNAPAAAQATRKDDGAAVGSCAGEKADWPASAAAADPLADKTGSMQGTCTPHVFAHTANCPHGVPIPPFHKNTQLTSCTHQECTPHAPASQEASTANTCHLYSTHKAATVRRAGHRCSPGKQMKHLLRQRHKNTP